MNERLPWVTVGVDLFDVLTEEMAAVDGPLDLLLFLNVMSVKDAARLADLVETGRVARLRAVVDRGAFVLRQGADDGQVENAGDIEALLGRDRFRAINNHVKAACWRGAAGSGCLVSSANLNRNNRPECHDRVDGLAPVLEAVAERLFAEQVPGATPPGAVAWSGLGLAVTEASRSGLVHVSNGRVVGVDGVHLAKGVGVGDVLPTLIREAGQGASVWLSTWSLTDEHVSMLAGIAAGGADVRIWLPRRHAVRRASTRRRDANPQAMLAALANVGHLIRWSPAHAKVVVVDGPRCSFLVTGCANLGGLAALDMFHIRRGGREVAEHGRALLLALPPDEPFELPPPVAIEPPKQKSAKRSAPPPTASGWSSMLTSVVATAMARAGLGRGELAEDDVEGDDDDGDKST